MKRLLYVFLAVVCFISAAFPLCIAFGSTQQTNDIGTTKLGSTNTYYAFDASSGTLTISGTGRTPDFSNLETSIPWYEWRTTSIKKVVVEEGVTTVGTYMFYQVRATEFDLPSTIRTIGKYAFGYTLGITQWTFDFGLTSIGNYAFYCCSTMTTINLPSSVTTIGDQAFRNCYALANIQLPYSVTNVGSYAFYNCTSLTDVTFQSMSSSVTLGKYAFMNCSALECLNMPANAECNAGFYGFKNTQTMLDNISMRVFTNSSAMAYAVSNKIPYTTYDSIDVVCGVRYDGTFANSDTSSVHTYRFTPDLDDVYNIYTTGSTDVKGDVYCGNTLVGEADDIANSNRNFCITAELKAGVTYTIHIYSVHAEGDYDLYIFPDGITKVTAAGSVSYKATESTDQGTYRHFDITDSDLKGIILTINFTNGFSYRTFYTGGYYNKRNISYLDEQERYPFNCGSNSAAITFGDGLNAGFTVQIEHGYAEKTVAPTEDEDGYNLHYCVICGDSYKDGFVATPALHITGRCVLSDSPYGTFSEEIPYSSATITVDGRSYPVHDDGTWEVNTFGGKYCYLKFNNEYGKDFTIMVYVGEESVEYGAVPLVGYDINKDGRVNAIDYAIYKRELSDSLPDNYWSYGDNFLLEY